MYRIVGKLAVVLSGWMQFGRYANLRGVQGQQNGNGLDAKFEKLAKFRGGERATTKEEADSLRE
jgi:hypothetical protein